MAKMRRLVNADPQLRRLRLHAQQLIASKRHDLAEGVLRELLSIEPNDPAAHRQRAACLCILRRSEEALQQARIAVSLAPASDLALTILALNLKQCGQHDESVATYLQALQINPRCTSAIIGLAGAYASKCRWDDAMEMAERGLAIKADKVALLHIRAAALAAQGKEDDAIAAMMEFLRLSPDDAASQSTAGAILRQLGRPDQALEFAQRALAMNPASPEYHNALAQLKLKTRRFDDAQLHFAEAGEIYDSRREGQKGSQAIEIQSLMGQAGVNLRRRNFELAESQYRRILELNPEHGIALSLLAGVIGMQYRYDEALQLAREALQRSPKLPIAHVVLGINLAQMEQFEEASAHAREALSLDPESAVAHRLLSIIYCKKEDYEAAREWIRKAMQLKQDPETSRLLAVIYAGLGRREEAIATMDSAMREEPDYPSTYESAGLVFYLLGDFEQAAFQFRRAIELDNSRAGYLGWLGLAYVAMGLVVEGKTLLQRSIATDPYQRRVRNALANLSADNGLPGGPQRD